METRSDIEKMPEQGVLPCTDETYEEIWEKKLYSICHNCPKFESRIRYQEWDPSYVPDSEMFKSEEAVLYKCKEYDLEKPILFVKPKRKSINLKKARHLR